jgi:hypothetical protein
MEEEPLAERRDVGVGARAKMSEGWAEEIVWSVRYCLDCHCQASIRSGKEGGAMYHSERLISTPLTRKMKKKDFSATMKSLM